VFRSACLIALAVAVPLAWGQQLPTPNRPVLPAQQSPAPDPSAQSHPRSVMPAQDGGVREVLESIVIPPVANAPFTPASSRNGYATRLTTLRSP